MPQRTQDVLNHGQPLLHQLLLIEVMSLPPHPRRCLHKAWVLRAAIVLRDECGAMDLLHQCLTIGIEKYYSIASIYSTSSKFKRWACAGWVHLASV